MCRRCEEREKKLVGEDRRKGGGGEVRWVDTRGRGGIKEGRIRTYEDVVSSNTKIVDFRSMARARQNNCLCP